VLRQLDRKQWEVFFDRVSKGLRDETVEVEVVGEEVGDQKELQGAPLTGLTYDPEADELEIDSQGMEHIVPHPKAIYLEGEAHKQALSQVVVIDGEGHKQFIRLSPPLVAFPP
jgi:hypothetical protein